jgi:hypothetical protein
MTLPLGVPPAPVTVARRVDDDPYIAVAGADNSVVVDTVGPVTVTVTDPNGSAM